MSLVDEDAPPRALATARHRRSTASTPTTRSARTVDRAVVGAEDSVRRACAVVARHGGDPHSLRVAVHGAARLTRALAHAVDALARQAAETAETAAAVDDLIADLRALRNCLATGAAVVDPALDDLREASEPSAWEAEFAARFAEWAAASNR